MRVFREKHRMMFLRKLQRSCKAFVFRLRFFRSTQTQATLLERGSLQHRLYRTRRSVPRCVAFWRKWAGLRRTLAGCRFNLTVSGRPVPSHPVSECAKVVVGCLSQERRLMVTWFTWLHVFKMKRMERIASDKVKMAAVRRLQGWFRICIARSRVHKLRAFRKIVLAAKAFVTRKRFRRQLEFARRLQDYSCLYLSRAAHHATHRAFLTWRRGFYKVT